jgi:hypothetical protein
MVPVTNAASLVESLMSWNFPGVNRRLGRFYGVAARCSRGEPPLLHDHHLPVLPLKILCDKPRQQYCGIELAHDRF